MASIFALSAGHTKTMYIVIAVVGVLYLLKKFAKDPGPVVVSKNPEVTFANVAGCQEAIEDLADIVNYLKNPKKYEKLGAIPPKGALLSGPPGVGKTLLARAVATEAGVPFIACTGSDFVQEFVGIGSKRIRELFVQARTHKKVIIFIDEIDALARKRGSGGPEDASTPRGNAEHDNTLVALLSEIDGFTVNNDIVVLAATNRPDVLDPALTRPGRLDRMITVSLPDIKGRLELFHVHTKKKPMEKDVNLTELAAITGGMSGADIARVCNEAALFAAGQNATKISMAFLNQAVEYVVLGRPRLSAVVTKRDREIVAWHEAGHALTAALLDDAEMPILISIVPRGVAGGVTMMKHPEHNLLSLQQAEARLIVALGGRAAEQVHMSGEFTQGAAADLLTATQIATAMVSQYGMTSRGLSVRSHSVFHATDIATQEVIETLLETAYNNAVALLTDNPKALERLVAALLKNDTLRGPEIHKAIAKTNVTAKLMRVSDSKKRSKEGTDAAHETLVSSDVKVFQPQRKVSVREKILAILLDRVRRRSRQS
jgi:cell division protease FtsH